MPEIELPDRNKAAVKQPGSQQPAPTLRNPRWSAYRYLLLARLAELRREPEVIFWIFMFPILLAVGLGIAFRSRPSEIIHVAIVNNSGAQHAKELLESSPQKNLIPSEILDGAQAQNGFRLGKYALVVESRPDGTFTFRYDPAREESVLARSEINDALQSAAGRKNPISVNVRESSEPGARYIDFVIPGLLGMNLMNSGLWGIGFALVEMRQRKLLKRYVATPMRRSDFLLALASSRLLLMVVEVSILLAFGALAFHMRIIGPWWEIILIGAAGSISFTALGLLVASRAQKIETVSGLVNVVLMPMWIFCGVFFSYDRFPATVQPLIKALPLTALNDAFRSVILEGAPLATQGLRLIVMGVWAAVCFVLALRWFRWT